jgi:hypothetical protein
MRYTTVQRLVAEADTQARALGTNLDGRLAVYVMTLTSIHLALADGDPPSGQLQGLHGWERVTQLLADRRERLPIDALDSLPFDQARRHLGLIAEMPEVTGIATHQELVDLIGEAINRGAPRYNAGDARGCAALYWVFARLIYETPATRGFPGYARLQAQLKPLAEASAAPERMSDSEAESWAWELRYALDDAARSASA